MAGVDQQQGMIGTGQFGTGPAHAFLLDRVLAVTQPGGVDQGQGDRAQAHVFTQDIAGGAGDVGDDGAVVTGQGIEQR